MFDTVDRWAALVVGLAGLALVALGVFLPWVGETQLRVYVLGMDAGFERQWGKRLALGVVLAAVGAATSVTRFDRPEVGTLVLAGFGGLAVLVVVLTSPLTTRWPTEVGVSVTLAGAVLLLTTPAFGLLTE